MPESLHLTRSKPTWLLRRQSPVAIAAVTCWLCLGIISLTRAQNIPSPQQKFPVNPLEMNIPDILLPRSAKKQPLTPAQVRDRPLTFAERQKLEAGLAELDAQAQARFDAGDEVAAFDFWNRELRLRQALDPVAEVQALGRVGAFAWNQRQSKEVQFITARLQTVQQQASVSSANKISFWQALGIAFQQVRAPQPAVQVYQRVLELQRQQHQDIDAQIVTLQTIAQLSLSWFNYPQAAGTYQQLLAIAKSRGDRDRQKEYLQQLSYIYEQNNQLQQAVATQQQLVEFYLSEKDLNLLPALRLQLASDYAALGQIEKAFENYREAYASAWSLQQYYLAAQALQKLIALYRDRGQTDAALAASQILLQADERNNDFYGMMNAYDQIGQIYLQHGNYPKAKAAFQNGLNLAKQLKYQEKYFTQRVAQVSQQMSR